jgi:integrase
VHSTQQRLEGGKEKRMASIVRRRTGNSTRYDVRWRDPDGRVRTKTFRLRHDADSWRRTVEAAEVAGVVSDPQRGRTPVGELAQRWLASSPAKRTTSLARDRGIVTGHVLPVLGGRPVGSITRADVQALVDGWSRTNAASTVGRQYSCLRAMFAYAEAAELIARSPCRGIRVPRVRLVDRPQLDGDVLKRVADNVGAAHGVMVWLGAVLGLRWAEAAGLTVGDVDVLGRMVTVRHQLGRDG